MKQSLLLKTCLLLFSLASLLGLFACRSSKDLATVNGMMSEGGGGGGGGSKEEGAPGVTGTAEGDGGASKEDSTEKNGTKLVNAISNSEHEFKVTLARALIDKKTNAKGKPTHTQAQHEEKLKEIAADLSAKTGINQKDVYNLLYNQKGTYIKILGLSPEKGQVLSSEEKVEIATILAQVSNSKPNMVYPGIYNEIMPRSHKTDKITVSVENVGSGVVIIPALEINPDDKVGSLRREAILSRSTSLGIRLFLGHGGKELSDNNVTLRDASVKDGSTIVVVHITLELYLARQKEAMRALYQLLPDGVSKDGALASLNNHPTNPSKWVDVRKVSEEGFILEFDLGYNQLTGPIPRELGSLTKLQRLDLSFNQLTGPIPTELGQLTELEDITLFKNQLTGPIPRELGQLTKLQYLSLFANQLAGPLPRELGQLTKLKVLSLSKNQLTGPIPRELGLLTELTFLSLNSNQLTGEIPRKLGQLTELQTLSLSKNQLTGEIPRELGLLTKLQRLDLSDNQLTGEIPPELIERGVRVSR